MSSTATDASRAAVDAATITEAFHRTVAGHGDEVAFRTQDGSVELTWAQARERVDAIAGGLAELGLRRGDTIAILLSNRPEFHLVDLAAITLGPRRSPSTPPIPPSRSSTCSRTRERGSR